MWDKRMCFTDEAKQVLLCLRKVFQSDLLVLTARKKCSLLDLTIEFCVDHRRNSFHPSRVIERHHLAYGCFSPGLKLLISENAGGENKYGTTVALLGQCGWHSIWIKHLNVISHHEVVEAATCETGWMNFRYELIRGQKACLGFSGYGRVTGIKIS